MGLDSVELIIAMEDFFRVSIPDAHAEKIYTVQDMVNEVAFLKKITSEDMSLRNELFEQIKVKLCNPHLCLSDAILNDSDMLNDKMFWTHIENELQLKVPKPESKKYLPVTVSAFIESILAFNYTRLIEGPLVKNRYEIYIGVKGISYERLGIDMYEISSSKSFTDDFGID